MTHHNHHSGAYGILGLLALTGAIAYAFGNKAAQVFVAALLIIGGVVSVAAGALFVYVCYRIVVGTI